MIRLRTRYDGYINALNVLMWMLWAVLNVIYINRGQECLDKFVGRSQFLEFRYFELTFMFGGWFLLLGLLSLMFNKYLVWVVVELLFLAIVAMHVKLYFSC